MLRLRRKRYPHINLRARYVCPVCGPKPGEERTEENSMMFTVSLRPWSEKDPTPCLFGRPTAAICDCGTEMEYEGFVRRV